MPAVPECADGRLCKIDLEHELSSTSASTCSDSISLLENSVEKVGVDETVLLCNWHLLDLVDTGAHSHSTKGHKRDLVSPYGSHGRDSLLSQTETTPLVHLEDNLRTTFSIEELPQAKRDADRSSCFWPYLLKMRGTDTRPPARDGVQEIGLCAFGSFSCMLLLGAIDHFFLRDVGYLIFIPAFAAMAVVLFTKIGAGGPLAQPPNVIFGHLVSAVVGVTCHVAFGPELKWISAPVAVSLTIAIMSLTSTVHPAAGATAVAAIYGGERCTSLGYWFVLLPVFVGTVITFIMALLINNLSPRRRYPLYWSMR